LTVVEEPSNAIRCENETPIVENFSRETLVYAVEGQMLSPDHAVISRVEIRNPLETIQKENP